MFENTQNYPSGETTWLKINVDLSPPRELIRPHPWQLTILVYKNQCVYKCQWQILFHASVIDEAEKI